jgi:glycosyltransferase involved in cell wall biosynthesis
LSAAIDFAGDAFVIPRDKPMGRNFAGHGFLSAFVRHSSSDEIAGFVATPQLQQSFTALVKGIRPDRPVRCITAARIAELREVGCLYTSSVMTASQVWLREMHGPRTWSICGVNHTLSSARAMDAVAGLLTAPVQPWDALICTSAAARDVVRRLLGRQSEYLARRLGASRFVLPQLPVIPLGVDCDAQQREMTHRDPARAALGIGPEDVVVLFLGRISFHAKASPVPMYLALERIAKEMPRRGRITIVECGWTPNEAIARAFAEARAQLCPSVRSIVLDGREPACRTQAWAAADVFCSLSDNIQESFGLTPIEAMAAGLPVVVTDWDGYRDTVRHEVDGFAVPTVFAPPGTGTSAAARHAAELDTYDIYIGQIAATTAVDVDAATDALGILVRDPELRRRMGASAAERARRVFDWKVVIRAYEELWAKLAEMRRSADAELPGPRRRSAWPARPDPFELFASFPTSILSARHRIVAAEGIEEEEASARLRLRASMADIVPELSLPAALETWRRLGPGEATVEAIVASQTGLPSSRVLRALLMLAKAGLVTIRAP